MKQNDIFLTMAALISGLAISYFLFADNRERPEAVLAVGVAAQGDSGSQENRVPFPVLASNLRDHSERTGEREVVQTDDGPVYADFKTRPFPVTRSSRHHEWTEMNGLTEAAIDQLAHSDEERERLQDENTWVTRRELVYRKEGLPAQAAAAQASGTEIKELILPGFDGREYIVEVTASRMMPLENGIASGTVMGHLKEDPESQVKFSFYADRETGAISSKKLNLELAYDPREGGQVVVKEVYVDALEFALEGKCGTDHSELAVGEAGVIEE